MWRVDSYYPFDLAKSTVGVSPNAGWRILARVGALVFFLAPASALAQSPPTGMPRIPPVSAERALTGAPLADALREGGFVLYLRHTETGAVTQTCETSNLTAAGREAATRIGAAIKTLRWPIDKVSSSEICRVLETAKLLEVAPVEISDDLHNSPKHPVHKIHDARSKLIATPPPAKTNRLLAGHIQNGDKPEDRLFLDIGEIIVFRPTGDGKTEVAARIRAGEWQALLDADTAKRK
jgi:Histidine phosphatase superfamily (branch 1)